MHTDFSKIFHQSAKDHQKGHRPIASNPDEWPDEWRTTYYKTYPRFPQISLGETLYSDAHFFKLVSQRQSGRDYSQNSVSQAELSTMLTYSCGITSVEKEGRKHRAHPSAGGRYPIEVYPLVLQDGEIPAGLHHYNVKSHSLDVLWKREFTDAEISTYFSYSWVKSASVVFVLTALFARNQNKYGERGYRYILLEAGHIAQNMYLCAEALGLKCCALAGTRDEALEKLIDIDGINESVVYAIALGHHTYA